MSHIKQQFESLLVESNNIQIRSKTCIENLSNELFYKIFEYLDGWNIYKIFFELNYRFRCLITSPSFLLKVQLRSLTTSELRRCCKNVIIPNKHRILSLYLENESLINKFFTYCFIDSSFYCLQSIVLRSISISSSLKFLSYFKSLSHLLSLTIYIDAQWGCDLHNIYPMILSFPCLEYYKISLLSAFNYENTNACIPLAMNKQISTIEYLIIDHPCSFDELFSVLYYTPRLRHLTCTNLLPSHSGFKNIKPILLSNLIHINIGIYDIWFHHYDMFIEKLFAPVQVLRIKCHTGADIFDANEWEELIKTHLPYLRRFDYEYHEDYPFGNEMMLFLMTINQFTSPFWIEHQWFFNFTINMNKGSVNGSIHSSKNILLDTYKHSEMITYFDESIRNSLNPLTSTIQLSINGGNSSDKKNRLFIDKFKTMFSTVDFTRLNINCKNIPIGMLVRIIYLLPNLDSLKVSSLSLFQSDWLFDGDAEIRFLTSTNNKITKVNLEKMNHIEQVHFLLYLCPQIQYFQVDIPNHMNREMLIRFILIKSSTYIPHLNCLCLSISNANENMMYQLQKLIGLEKLLFKYNIKRIYNNIVLKWNRC